MGDVYHDRQDPTFHVMRVGRGVYYDGQWLWQPVKRAKFLFFSYWKKSDNQKLQDYPGMFRRGVGIVDQAGGG